MNTLYLQLLSMTEHTQALQGRFKGPYTGLNSQLHTSQVEGNSLMISNRVKGPKGEIDKSVLANGRIIIAYRHTDGGMLQGTSETLIPVLGLPWKDLPGIEIEDIFDKEGIQMKLWNQPLRLSVDQVTRIHFMKTVVYLRNFGTIDNITWTDQNLEFGPSKLHAEMIDQDLTLAPPSASGLQVKAGQETTH